jgi:predicted extracellular nuclease
VLRAVPDDLGRYAGMRVRIAAPLTVAGSDSLDKYGEIALNFGDRLRTPSDAARPGDALQAIAADNARRTLLLDDGSDAEHPANVAWLPPSGAPRAGTRVRGVEGVIDERHGAVLVLPTAPPRFVRPATPRPPQIGGDLRVAGFNLENFFNGDGHGGGYPTPRGARTEAEHQIQQARLVATIRGLKPDIAALMELENDGFGPDSALAQLVAALNRAGDGDWRFVATDADQGADAIRVGLIYRASRVRPVGTAATLTDDLFGSRSRPPLAQSFRAGDGPVFTVVANHFKSKGCGGATGDDADRHDGQGCWNAARTTSARRLDAWLRTDPTHSGSDLAMIVGDLNAYSKEDPVQALVDAGWRDAFAGQRETPYSYVYAAQTGRLDHALLSPTLAARLAGAAEWHVNADEPDSRGYQTHPEDRSPRRSSDHDPLVVGFRLRRP